eukprot:TRINITY_DN542_c0_g1_i2.p2 TRINITY_DN542_c0_g1~~TRINITY_DN542_c0_g1_i2.p2  ORF type:complete len:567 (+),score=160.88 TRINITY_DN542_c0_g1_i2:53-1753(+)
MQSASRRTRAVVAHLAPQAAAAAAGAADDHRAALNARLRPLGIEIVGTAVAAAHLDILTPEALGLVAQLHRAFGARRKQLLAAREARYARFVRGELPDFLPETQAVRDGAWKVAPIPADLQDRRVEITGPVDRKMVINALNSGASCFMADFEDSNAPTFDNNVSGQANLRDAVRRTISLAAPGGKAYKLNAKTATLLVRPRGWHLDEKHVLVDGERVSGSLFDFAVFLFHNAAYLLAHGSGPYFYLPKMESHLEARLWNDVFVAAQAAVGIPQGSIRATVLIETILAAFEMDEILFELRDHSAGLNCGRWDYIFSYIKKFRHNPRFVTPDRVQIGMTVDFMQAYVKLLIDTCHRRGIHAMGGMAAIIPIKEDAAKNAAAMDKVRADKLREVKAGHDGTWVAHPALVGIAKAVFDEHMRTPNQIHVLPGGAKPTAAQLLQVPKGTITREGLKENISVAVAYVEAWLRGVGCVPLNNLMEDAATAEIARVQVWQWVRHGARLADGGAVTKDVVVGLLREAVGEVRAAMGPAAFGQSKYAAAAALLEPMLLGEDSTWVDFLTLPAYEQL